jgi:hypothetical protein
MVPTFTLEAFDGVGAQLCPCNIATATPQAFTMASRPKNRTGQRVRRTNDAAARHNPALIRQVRAGGFLERLSNTGSLSLRLPVLLAGPEPSDGTDPSRHCQGCFPPSPPFRGSDCPQLHPAATTTRPRCPFITARFTSASWRTNSFTQRAVARLRRSRSIRRRATSRRS